MAKLKPCPFCGAPAKRLVQPAGESEGYYSGRDFKCAVYCSRPGCGATIQFIYVVPAYVKDPAREAKRIISRAWNRRISI